MDKLIEIMIHTEGSVSFERKEGAPIVRRTNSVTPGVDFTRFICNDVFENGLNTMRSAKSPSETKMRSSSRNFSHKSVKSVLKDSTKNIEEPINLSNSMSAS